MRGSFRAASSGVLFFPLLLAGCSLLSTTRKLPVPKTPTVLKTATPEELIAQLDKRWEAIQSLTATVEIQASVIKPREGVATDYTTVRGHILMRKPEMLRVVGQILGMRAFDMASDGKNFTLSIPSKNKVIEGSNSLRKKSASALENLRPGFFFDAMLIRGLEPDDLYSVVTDSETVEDAARKHLYTVPEYVLGISRSKPGSRELTPVRVITFNRDDLQPYQQDVYDSEGNLETQVFYADYRDFEGVQYPSTIVIKRPLEDIQIRMTVEDVKENLPLSDDQFVVKIPAGTPVQKME